MRKGCVRVNFVVWAQKQDVFYKIYHRADHLLHEYLHNFVAACNTRAAAALGELDLAIPRCRTDQFSR